MTDSSSSFKTTFKELVSIIDRAWEAKWALQLVQLLLFLDLAMISAGQPGMIGWNSETTPVLSNLNFVFVSLVAFTVYAAFLTPLLGMVMSIVVANIPGLIPSVDTPQPPGHVSLSEYKEVAYARNNKDMIARYHERESSNRSAETQQKHLGTILLGTLILIICNAFPQFLLPDTSKTILQLAIALAGWVASLVIGLILVLGMFSAMTQALFYSANRWIEHPKLYRELESKRRKEKQELGLPPYSR